MKKEQPGSNRPHHPLAIRSTVDAAAEWLREGIMRGDFKPGERLVEQKLAARLSIGQPTLREALKELEHQGFVRKTPKRGTRVTQLTAEDFRHIQEVRMALETVVIERVATRMTPELTAQLRQCVLQMEAAAQRFDLLEFHEHDVTFHRLLWNACGNDFLATALERVAFGLFAFVILQRESEATHEFLASARQHRDIVEGLQTGDPRRAAKAFEEATDGFWGEFHKVQRES